MTRRLFLFSGFSGLLGNAVLLVGCLPTVERQQASFMSLHSRPLSSPFPARFWGYDSDWDRPGAGEHPCGPVFTKIVTTMPNLSSSSRLVASPANEIDRNGKIVSAWALPVQAEPMHVAGDWLLVKLEVDDRLVWIGRNGDVRDAVAIPQNWGRAPTQECRSTALNYDSWCQIMTDRLTQQRRIVAAETICS